MEIYKEINLKYEPQRSFGNELNIFSDVYMYDVLVPLVGTFAKAMKIRVLVPFT